MKRRSGFTLIELLVVISIIALLSSVVLASLNAAREKARLAAGRQFASQVDRVAGELALGIWDFNDCSGSSAVDRSGFGNNGSLANSPAWSSSTPSGTGCSLSFNGSNQYVNAGASVALEDNSPFTYSVWINFTASQTAKTIMGKHSNSPGGSSLGIDDSQANRLKFHLNVYGSQRVNGSTALNDGLWHHVAGVWDGASLKLYVDGRLDASAVVSSTLTYTSSDFQIGKWAGGTQYFNGLIDEPRVFAKALTASEVGAIYAERGVSSGLASVE